MANRGDEERRLRAVAPQNARSIVLVQQGAEKALRKPSEWLRVTLASIGGAVISTDAEGRVGSCRIVSGAEGGDPGASSQLGIRGTVVDSQVLRSDDTDAFSNSARLAPVSCLE